MSSESIYTSHLCSCIICREIKYVNGIHSHYVSAHTEEGRNKCTIGGTKSGLIHKEKCKLETEIKEKLYLDNPNHCKHCNYILPFNKKQQIFCSKKCSNTYKNLHTKMSQSQKDAIGNGIRGKPSNKPKYTPVSQCKVCNKWFKGHAKTCSKECKTFIHRETGKKNAANKILRSKDEIKLFELCQTKFINVEHNKPIFNGWDADIIIYDIKIAILWNGPWHYKEMGLSNHSLLQVQNRDKIKQKEIEALGWKCIIFEDRYYTPEKAFNELVAREW